MKISIVTPSYNSGDYIEETISSIKAQNYQNYEHIVVDGKSMDETIDIVKKYSEIKLISEPDVGQSDALNKGFRIAMGDILAWQNADDRYLPGTFQKVVDFFRDNPEDDIVYGYYKLIDENGEWICDVKPIEWDTWKFKHFRFVPLQPTVFWRRRVYQKLGDLDIGLNYTMDLDMFAKAVNANFKFKLLPDFLGEFRVHNDSKTQNNINLKQIRKEGLKVLSLNFNYNNIDTVLFYFFFYRSRIASGLKKYFFKASK